MPRSILRRNFLRTSSCLTLTALGSGSLCRVFAQLERPKIGIQLYSVRDDLRKDPLSTLKSLYQMGYREVETAGYANLPVKEFARMVLSLGFICPSAHLDLSGPDLGPQFESASLLGAKYATTGSLRLEPSSLNPASSAPSGSHAPDAVTDMFKRMAERMNRIAMQAKVAGLRYAYHNHYHEFVQLGDGRLGYDLLIQETDPDLVRFEIDCGWMIVAGSDPIAYMNQYPNRIRMLHIKDFKTKPADAHSAEGAELGTGFIDYRPILAVGRSIRIEHYFAEQEGPYRSSELDSAGVASAYLKSSL